MKSIYSPKFTVHEEEEVNKGESNGYCIKCKKKIILKEPVIGTFKNKKGFRWAVAGKCPHCNQVRYRFTSR